MEKICENACKLTLIGESFDDASEYVERSNRNNDKAAYIIIWPQMKNMFFSGCSQKRVNEYWKVNHKYEKNGNPYLYMPLPHNFKDYIIDLNDVFLAGEKIMELD